MPNTIYPMSRVGTGLAGLLPSLSVSPYAPSHLVLAWFAMAAADLCSNLQARGVVENWPRIQ